MRLSSCAVIGMTCCASFSSLSCCKYAGLSMGTRHNGQNLEDLLEMDDDADPRIRELKAVHARKIKSLLTSISNLQEQNATLQRETKTHNVAQAVQKIQKRLREQELVSDVLKTMLTDASGQSRQEIDQKLVLKTIGGPKRFRPKTREEMALELEELHKKYQKSISSLREAREATVAGGGSVAQSRRQGGSVVGSVAARSVVRPSADVQPEDKQKSELDSRLAMIQATASVLVSGSQLTTLQDSLKSSELALRLKQEEVDALKKENDELRQKLVATRPLERKAANANTKLAKAVEIIQTMRSERVNLAADAQTAATSLRKLELEVRVVRDELDRLQQASQLHQERDASTIDSLRAEMTMTESKLSNTTRELAAASESLSEARQELARLSKELTDVHSQKRQMDALHSQTSVEKQEVEKQLADTLEHVNVLNAKIDRLQKDGDQLREQEQDARHRIAVLENDLNSKEEAMESLGQSDMQRMKQVEDLTHQIGALQIALNELKEVHATLEEKHGIVLADLELTEKKMIVAKALANHNRKHRSALSGQLSQAHASLTSAQENLESVSQALSAESEAKRALATDLAATAEALAAAKKRAASLASSSDNSSAQLAVLNHELEMMQQRATAAEVQLLHQLELVSVAKDAILAQHNFALDLAGMVKAPPAFPELHPLVLELVGPLDYTVVPVSLTPKASQANVSSHTSLLSAGGLYPSDRHISPEATPVSEVDQRQSVNKWAQLAVSAAPTTDEDQHPAEYFDTAEQEQYYPEDVGTSGVAYDYSVTDTSHQAGQSYEGHLDDDEYHGGYLAHREGGQEVSGAGEMLDDDADGDGDGSLYDDVPDTATESKPATASVHESSHGNLHAGGTDDRDNHSSDFFGSDPDDDSVGGDDPADTAPGANGNSLPVEEDDDDDDDDDMQPF